MKIWSSNFHTNNDSIYNFITSLWDFEGYDLKCKVVMDNINTTSPFNFQTIDDFYPENKAQILKEHKEFIITIKNNNVKCKMAR